MKILKVLLMAICFSSLIYADEPLIGKELQEKAFIMGVKGSIVTRCLDDYKLAAERKGKKITDQELEVISKVCDCSADGMVEKLGGYDYFFQACEKDINECKKELANRITKLGVNQIKAVVEDCAIQYKNLINNNKK